jgi:two-component system sensor histidine kinase/response regulator
LTIPYHIYKILVAEDNYINQKLIKKLLHKKGYNTLVVEDGKKVIDVLQNQQYDVILMDIQMPIMDGYQATAYIREKERLTGEHIPIIGITAFAMESDRQKCFAIGMDDYLSKPFHKDDFYDVIEKHLIISATTSH